MKKRILFATLSLGGLMFAQTPTYTETKPVETAPISTPVATPEPTAAVPVAPASVPGTFSIGADFRTRSELNNGQFTLIKSGTSPTNVIFSRARLNFDYKKDKLTLKFAPQMVRKWGQTTSFTPTGASSGDQFEVYEAWAQYAINPSWAIKLGRMPLSYDDERLFGALDWQMQGRNFDAAKLIYTKGKAKLELAGLYNYDNTVSKVNGNEVYTIADGGENSKSIQLMHYENSLGEKFKFSLIVVNNTVQLQSPTDSSHNSMQTYGINPRYKVNDKFSVFGSAYYQGGRNTGDISKSAYQFSGNLEIKPTAKLTSVLGVEILSGTAYDDTSGKNNPYIH